MITAEQAKNMTEQASATINKRRMDDELEKAMRDIKKAANDGLYMARISTRYTQTKDKLVELGYKVDEYEDYSIVSWQ